MSESRELDTGPIDGGGERKKDAEGTEEEEEEEAKLNDGSSENPPQLSENEEEGNPSKRQKVTECSSEGGDDQTQIATSNVVAEAELGDSSSEGANHQEEQPDQEGREYPHVEPDSDDDDDETEDIFLFEMTVPLDNTLTIPAETAREYFPTLFFSETDQHNLHIDDFRGQLWDVPFTYNRETDGFTNTNQWKQISSLYNLTRFVPCLILFYRPAFRSHTSHYLIEFERRMDYQYFAPIFKANDLLFELELSENDIWMSRLFIPSELVHQHFPAIRIAKRSRKMVVVKFTDAQGKNWYMEIVRYAAEKYMVIKWWAEFVRNHGLEAMDVIRFYKPEMPSHSKHFFIEIVKKGDGTNSNESNQPGGGSGVSRKGKEIVAG